MTMPDGNSAAESRHAHEQAEGEKLREMYAGRALDDLVWRVMDGQEYPKGSHGWRNGQVNLTDILAEEADAAKVAAVICDTLHGSSIAAKFALRNGIESIVRDYLRDSKWHEQRIAEMIEEAKDEQG